MLLDILIFIPILMCILFGLRDGTVRKLVAIAILIAGLILGQLYMHDVGNLLAGHGGKNQEGSPITGFLFIFLGLLILQGFLYRILAKNYKIGGFVDRIGGIVLGFIEGVLFVSSLLLIFATSEFPDKNNKRDSQFYKSVVNIAPQILDMTSTVGPEVLDKIKDATLHDSDNKDKIKKELHK
jgi:membrane protein required for colicin V production